MSTGQTNEKLIFTVAWDVHEDQLQAATDILSRFVPAARKEPGLEHLTVMQSVAEPTHFLFYEVFKDAAAFETHQQTPHFKTMILEQALPLLAKRERRQYREV